jgi:uncharacterized surface protein with fasciclin (FAS1) repeats
MTSLTRHHRTALAGAALAVGLLASAGASAQNLRNCIDTLQGMPDYSRFVGAVIRTHLVNDFRNAREMTIFAPTNEAAGKLSQVLIDRVFPVTENQRDVDPVLGLAAVGVHTVPATMPITMLTNGLRMTTTGGSALVVTVTPGTPPVTTVTAANGVVARVVQPGIPCSNGVIHGIDTVLFK